MIGPSKVRPPGTPPGGEVEVLAQLRMPPCHILNSCVAFPFGHLGTLPLDPLRPPCKLPNVSALVNANFPLRSSASHSSVWSICPRLGQAVTPSQPSLPYWSTAPRARIGRSSHQITTGSTPYLWMLPIHRPHKIRQIFPSRRGQTPPVPPISLPPTHPSAKLLH